jgi:hypothetical protein
MQVLPHSFWPDTVQEHVPPTQVVPPEQTWPHEPQLFMSVLTAAHTPPEHSIVPDGHMVEHVPFAQTCVPVQACPHEPQLLVSWATHAPLQLRRPLPQTQAPL